MIVDVNVNLSRWPCRRLPFDDTPSLVETLRRMNVTQAWAGSFDALLHKDIAAVNARLADECRQHGDGLLVPFGSVNPMLPDWEEDVRRCHEEHKMPGIRLHPNYHGYRLDEPMFARLIELATERALIVQIAVKMEDERTQHRLLRVPPVDLTPLLDLLTKHDKLRVIILNGLRTLRPDEIERLSGAGQVYFEISMQEGVGGIEQLLKSAPLERVLFGSYFPFFYFESALLKMRESELAGFQQEAISFKNAQRLLGERQHQ